jgi:hypothetical protein
LITLVATFELNQIKSNKWKMTFFLGRYVLHLIIGEWATSPMNFNPIVMRKIHLSNSNFSYLMKKIAQKICLL